MNSEGQTTAEIRVEKLPPPAHDNYVNFDVAQIVLESMARRRNSSEGQCTTSVEVCEWPCGLVFFLSSHCFGFQGSSLRPETLLLWMMIIALMQPRGRPYLLSRKKGRNNVKRRFVCVCVCMCRGVSVCRMCRCVCVCVCVRACV